MTDTARGTKFVVMLLTGILPFAISGCGTPSTGSSTGQSASMETPSTSEDVEVSSEETTGASSDVMPKEAATDGPDDSQAGIWVPVRICVRHDIGDGSQWTTKETTYKVDDEGNLLGFHVAEDGTGEDAKGSDDVIAMCDDEGLVTSLVFTAHDGLSGQGKEVTFSYGRDDTGNVTQIEARSGSSKRSFALSYDDADFLREVTGEGLSLTFDESGRILSEVEIGSILPTVDGEYRFDYDYDADGNLSTVTRSYPGKLGIGTDSADASVQTDENGNLSELTFDMKGGKTHTTYEYQYVANPSDGARLYWHGAYWLLASLTAHL